MNTRGGFLISQIKQVQGRLFEKLLTDAGISDFNGAQGRILYVLWLEDNLSIVEIAARTGLAKTTLTSMLERMESKGHVRKCFDQEDKRKVRICLTEKAKSMEEKYREVSEQMNRIFYKGFTDQEIAEFDHELERILKNLEE